MLLRDATDAKLGGFGSPLVESRSSQATALHRWPAVVSQIAGSIT